MVARDWSGGEHWNGGRRERCRWCGSPSFLLDGDGVPAHKVCAEAIADDQNTLQIRETAFDLGRSA